MTAAPRAGAFEAGAEGAGGGWLAAFLEVDGRRVAVPAALVDQAIETPEALGPALPGRPAMLGSLVHADLAFPLVDLGRLLGLPGEPGHRRPTAALLGVGGRRVALAVDRVESLAALPPGAVVRLWAGDGVPAFALATLAERSDPMPGRVPDPVIVLEERDLLSAEGLVLAQAPAAAMGGRREGGVARREGRGGAGGGTYLGFSRAGVAYGVDIARVCEIVLDVRPAAMALPMPGFLGTIGARRGEAMLLDHPAPGSGEPAGRGAPSHAVVLEAEGLRFAVPADAIHGLRRLGAEDAAPLPAAAGETRRLVPALAPSAAGAAPGILLDAAAILAAPGVRPLVEKQNDRERARREAAGADVGAGLGPKAGEEALSGPISAGPLRSFVELRAGGRLFVRLEDVRELATLPRASVVLRGARPGLDGYARHRGEAIAVIDLVSRLAPGGATGRAPAEEARLAIVSTEGGQVGFVVEGFESIEHVRVTEAKGRPGGGRAAYERHWRLLHATSRRGDTRVVPELDLMAIAREAGADGPLDAPEAAPQAV